MEQLTLDIGIEFDEGIDRQTDRQTLSLPEKIERSQKALRLAADMSKAYYGEPLIITYSGGKDSDVLLYLAEGCLNPDDFEVLNSHTTVDAPETVYHIRDTFKRLNAKGVKTTIDYHKKPDGTNETMCLCFRIRIRAADLLNTRILLGISRCRHYRQHQTKKHFLHCCHYF